MQIVIPKKVKRILIALLIATLLVIGFLAIRPALAPRPATTVTGTSSDSQAAVDSATAFYTLDYTEDISLWTTRVCATATEAGCRAIRDFYAPAVQATMQEHQIQTGCTTEPVRLVSDANQYRIWQVRVSLDHPWPGLDISSQDVYVELSNVNGKWLMNRILFQQEVERLATPTP